MIDPIGKIQTKEIQNEYDSLISNLTPTEQNKLSLEKNQNKNIDKQNIMSAIDSLSKDIQIKLIPQGVDNDNLDLSSYVDSVIILKNYESSLKPIYRIYFSLPLQIVKEINKLRNYQYQISIFSQKQNPKFIDQSNQAKVNNEEKTLVYGGKLIPFNVTQEEEHRKSNKTLENIPYINYYIEAFDINHVKSGHPLFSGTFESITFKKLILYILNKFKELNAIDRIKNLIFCEPDISYPIKSITIPPSNLVDTLNFIQNKYGIYDRKLNMFLDEDTLFLYKRSYTDKLKTGKPSQVTILCPSDNIISQNSFINDYLEKHKDDKNIYIVSSVVVSDNRAIVMNNTPEKAILKTDKSLYGVESECCGFKDEGTLLKSLKYNSESAIISNMYEGKEVFMKKGNEMSAKLIIDQAQADSFSVALNILNGLMSDFHPLVSILLVFESEPLKKYNGRYYIKNATFSYTKNETFQDYSSETFLILGRSFDSKGNILK